MDKMDKLDFVCRCVLKDMAKGDDWTKSYESLGAALTFGKPEDIPQWAPEAVLRIYDFCALFDAIEYTVAVYNISHEEQSKTAAKGLMMARVRKYLQDEKKKRKA